MRHRTHAFTLMEIILALTLSMGLIASVFAFYRRTAEIRDHLTHEMQKVDGQRAAMDRLTGEFQGAIVYPFLGIGLEGTGDTVTFVNPVLVGPQAWDTWTENDPTAEPVRPRQDLQMIGYRLRASRDGDDIVRVEGLERTSQTTLLAQMGDSADKVTRTIVSNGQVTDVEEGPEVEAVLVSSAVKFFAIRYWDGSAWQTAWGGGDLPLGVEITMGTEPLPEGVAAQDYPYEVSRRVVFLPGGIKAMQVSQGVAEAPATQEAGE